MKSLPYILFKIPQKLEDLLDKAKQEGEYKIHIITNYIPINSKRRIETSVRVGYYHGKNMREIRQYGVSSQSDGYRKNLRIDKICREIKEAGLKVQMIRKRRFGKN